ILGDRENPPGPEVDAALKTGQGANLRMNQSRNASYLFVAMRASDGVLRLEVPAAQIDAQVHAVRTEVMLSTALAVLPFMLLAAIFARYVSHRLGTIIEFTCKLAEGNFRARLGGKGRGELGLLSAKLNETSEKLEFMMDRLETEHAELEKLERIRKDFV